MIRKRCKTCRHIKSKHSDGRCDAWVQVGSRDIRHFCNCNKYIEEEYDTKTEKEWFENLQKLKK